VVLWFFCRFSPNKQWYIDQMILLMVEVHWLLPSALEAINQSVLVILCLTHQLLCKVQPTSQNACCMEVWHHKVSLLFTTFSDVIGFNGYVQAGKYVTPDVTRALVVVISNASELQGYTVRALYRVFQAWDGQVLLLILSTFLFPKLCGCSPIGSPPSFAKSLHLSMGPWVWLFLCQKSLLSLLNNLYSTCLKVGFVLLKQESLGQVTVWCIGEYGEMLVDNLNKVEGEEPLTVSCCFLPYPFQFGLNAPHICTTDFLGRDGTIASQVVHDTDSKTFLVFHREPWRRV
jgi:hypothetical protein